MVEHGRTLSTDRFQHRLERAVNVYRSHLHNLIWRWSHTNGRRQHFRTALSTHWAIRLLLLRHWDNKQYASSVGVGCKCQLFGIRFLLIFFSITCIIYRSSRTHTLAMKVAHFRLRTVCQVGSNKTSSWCLCTVLNPNATIPTTTPLALDTTAIGMFMKLTRFYHKFYRPDYIHSDHSWSVISNLLQL